MSPLALSVALVVALLEIATVSGFGVVPALQSRANCRSTSTSLFAIRCEEKFYQLEEMEDAETCTTELFLKEDRFIEFGQTDGPLPLESFGYWDVKPGTNDFTMTIKRLYGSGSDGSDIGEFQYTVERTYIGEMTLVGESVGITGVAHSLGPDHPENQECGYFNMIDGTKERESYGKEEESESTNNVAPQATNYDY